MTKLLLVIVGRQSDLPKLLTAWKDIGVPGVTILHCGGESWARTWLTMLGVQEPRKVVETETQSHRIALAAMYEGELLDAAVAEAERIVGGFNQPGSGLLLVLPVDHALGLHGARGELPGQTRKAALAPAVTPGWKVKRDTPVSEVANVMDLQPTVVRVDAPLHDVALAMLEHPAVHVACVVNEDGRLTGLIDLHSLADHLFRHILPEDFISEISDLAEAMEYADASRVKTAADAMAEPAWLRIDDTVKDAFRLMHDKRVPGLPIVDASMRIVGYINLLELIAVCETGSDRRSEDSAGGQDP
jgi:CBS domain-containing protein